MNQKSKPDLQPCCSDIRKCRPVTRIKASPSASGARGEPDPRQFFDPRFNGSDCPYLR